MAETPLVEMLRVAGAYYWNGDKSDRDNATLIHKAADTIASLHSEVKRLKGELAEYAKHELYQLMSDISEDCYCAGWLIGNEYRLWNAITDPNDDRRYGMSEIAEDDIARLRELSAHAGGWWMWEDKDDSPGAMFIALAEWEKHVSGLRAALNPSPAAQGG